MEKKTILNKLLVFFLAFTILIGDVVKVQDVRILGVVITLYRVAIPMYTIYFLIKRIREHKFSLMRFSKYELTFYAVMIFWIVYGTVALFVSPYAQFGEGLKEILSLTLGCASVFCVCESCKEKKYSKWFVESLKVITLGLILMALFENFTNIHFYSSKLYHFVDYNKLNVPWYMGFGMPKLFAMTTIFFNINDFCAFLSIMLPLFFYDASRTKKRNLFDLVVLFLGIIILAMNDANIVIVALVLAMIVYTILSKERKKNMMVTGVGIYLALSGFRVFQTVAIFIKNKIYTLSPEEIEFFNKKINGNVFNSAAQTDMGDVISSQISTAVSGTGSLFNRWVLYLESLKVFLKTYCLGLGPAGFQPYFENHKHKGVLVNPHNWWLEILTGYGIFVFVAYVCCICWLFINMIKRYLVNRKGVYLQVVAMCTTFVIASIAPSSFLGYSYQWILPALCIVLLKEDELLA